MRQVRRGRRVGVAALAVAVGLGAAVGLSVTTGSAQDPVPAEPWFGVALPPGLGDPHETPMIVGDDYGPVPATVPTGEEGFEELRGERIRPDLETIVNFSKQSQASQEFGSDQMWGRVTGFPTLDAVIEWSADQLRAAGIADVEVQRFDADPGTAVWAPRSWEVRVVGDPDFGSGTTDVVLESAIPAEPTILPGGTLSAPLVYVGTGTPAELAHIDVTGKVAVQHVTPRAGAFFVRGDTRARAFDLLARGAAAVFNVYEQPGNMHLFEFSGCEGPCFNIGGQDGRFLERVMDQAADHGVLDDLRVEITVDAENHAGLSAANAVAVIPGTSSSENIVINAHADGYFDAAGDNGDGLAVMLALARHFSLPEHRPERTLVFVASAGHHSDGLNGPRQFVALNPDLVANNVLVLNLEHVAQRNFAEGVTVPADGFRDRVADSVENPMIPGISNSSPFLQQLFAEGVQRYGLNIYSQATTSVPGELGGYASVGTPRVQVIYAGPLYHTSGDTLSTISEPGLERAARFFADFVAGVDAASADEIDPPPPPDRHGLVLFVAGSEPAPAGDRGVVSRLQAAGYTVTVVDDDSLTPADVDAAGVVLVSSSVQPDVLPPWLAETDRPLGTWEAFSFEGLGLADAAKEVASGADSIRMEPAGAGHPLAAGFTGQPAVFANPVASLNYGLAGTDATVIGREPGGQHRPVYFAYDEGDELPTGMAAPNRRVAFFPTYEGAPELRGAGLTMLRAVVQWLDENA